VASSDPDMSHSTQKSPQATIQCLHCIFQHWRIREPPCIYSRGESTKEKSPSTQTGTFAIPEGTPSRYRMVHLNGNPIRLFHKLVERAAQQHCCDPKGVPTVSASSRSQARHLLRGKMQKRAKRK
jgi:hypothetical protein